MLANKQNPKDAVDFQLDSKIDNIYALDRTPQFKALKLGVPVKQALMFKNTCQLEALKAGLDADSAIKIDQPTKLVALKLLGKEKVDIATKFSASDPLNTIIMEVKLEALKVILANKQNPEDALDFCIDLRDFDEYSYTPQFQALKLGVPVKQAMKFYNYRQQEALKLYKEINNIENFSNCNKLNPFSLESIEDALKIESQSQYQCLQLSKNFKEAIKCDSPAKALAYEIAKTINLPVDQAFQINNRYDFNIFLEEAEHNYYGEQSFYELYPDLYLYY